MIDELAAELEGTAIIGKVNMGNDAELAEKYSVTRAPTILVFKEGEEVERKLGILPLDQLKELIASHS